MKIDIGDIFQIMGMNVWHKVIAINKYHHERLPKYLLITYNKDINYLLLSDCDIKHLENRCIKVGKDELFFTEEQEEKCFARFRQSYDFQYVANFFKDKGIQVTIDKIDEKEGNLICFKKKVGVRYKLNWDKG